jgi:hypothetical protein
MENGWYWVRWGRELGGELEVLRFSDLGMEGGEWLASGECAVLDPRDFAVVARVEPPSREQEPLERILHRDK